MQQTPKYWSIVPAAGKGNRMGGLIPKQYLPLHGKSVIEHTLHVLFASCQFQKIVVVIDADDSHWASLAYAQHPDLITTIGGVERCH